MPAARKRIESPSARPTIRSMDELKTRMIEAAKSAGGTPPAGYNRLDDCFTYEPSLDAIILWYNVGGSTRIEIRSLRDASVGRHKVRH